MSQNVRQEVIQLIVDGKQVTASYNELKKGQREVIKNLRDLEEGTEDYIKEAQKLNRINKQLDDVQTNLKDVGKEWRKQRSEIKEGIRDNIRGFNMFGVSVGDVSDKYKLLSGSIGGTSKTLKIFKTALIATGIGAFVVLIGSLLSYFKRFQSGQEIINKLLAQMGAVVDVVLDRLGNLVVAAQHFFNGDFDKAAETFKNSFKGIGDEMSREVKLAGEISDGLAEIEKRQAALILTNAERERDVKALNKIAEDTTKSAQERLDAANLAIAIETQRMQDAVSIQRDKVALLEKEYDRSEGTTEDLVALNEERARVLELETQSLELQTTLQNKRNILQDQLIKEGQVDTLKIYRRGAEDVLAVEKQLEESRLRLKQLYVKKRGELSESEKDNEIEALYAVQDAADSFMLSMININSILGKQGEEMSEFHKAVALFQVGINTAVAISEAIKGATAAGAATGPAAPFTTPAFIASMLATVTGAFSQVNSIINQPSAPSFYHGGDTGSKSIGFGDKYGPFTGFVHPNEYVIPAAQRTDPVVANMESYLESRKKYGSGGSPINVNASANLNSQSFDASADRLSEYIEVLLQRGIQAVISPRTIDDMDELKQRRDRSKIRGKV
jgi:hypothetical protein